MDHTYRHGRSGTVHHQSGQRDAHAHGMGGVQRLAFAFFDGGHLLIARQTDMFSNSEFIAPKRISRAYGLMAAAGVVASLGSPELDRYHDARTDPGDDNFACLLSSPSSTAGLGTLFTFLVGRAHPVELCRIGAHVDTRLLRIGVLRRIQDSWSMDRVLQMNEDAVRMQT